MRRSAIQRAAARAGMDMSAYVLARVLSVPAAQFQDCVRDCADSASPRFALAELNSLLSDLTAGELRDAIATPPRPGLSPFLGNYIAAMVEYACARRAVAVPAMDALDRAADRAHVRLRSCRVCAFIY